MESCNRWICPNTICLQLLRLYRWAHGWWMMEEEVVLCVCLLFSHVLGWIQRDLCCGVCMRLPILDCRPYSECKKCVGVDWGSISAARLLFSSLWNLLIMCSFVKPVFYSSPVYISCSETIAPLLKSVNWMSLVVVGEKLSVEATVKFSIIKVSIITMLGKMFCFLWLKIAHWQLSCYFYNQNQFWELRIHKPHIQNHACCSHWRFITCRFPWRDTASI